jgi:hypothetical protein
MIALTETLIEICYFNFLDFIGTPPPPFSHDLFTDTVLQRSLARNILQKSSATFQPFQDKSAKNLAADFSGR